MHVKRRDSSRDLELMTLLQTCHTWQRRPRNEAGDEAHKPASSPASELSQSRRDYVVLKAGAGRRVADVLIFLIDNNK